MRLEFLAGRAFASLGQPPEELDAWVRSYSYRRLHHGIAMASPAQRFQSELPHDPAPAKTVIKLAEHPGRRGQGGQWITRKVDATPVICLAHQRL